VHESLHAAYDPGCVKTFFLPPKTARNRGTIRVDTTV
jgi:hypothetical protein